MFEEIKNIKPNFDGCNDARDIRHAILDKMPEDAPVWAWATEYFRYFGIPGIIKSEDIIDDFATIRKGKKTEKTFHYYVRKHYIEPDRNNCCFTISVNHILTTVNE